MHRAENGGGGVKPIPAATAAGFQRASGAGLGAGEGGGWVSEVAADYAN